MFRLIVFWKQGELKIWMLEQPLNNKGCSSIQFFIKFFFRRGARKFHFLKYKNFFSREIFFIFLSLGLKVAQVAAYVTTNENMISRAIELFDWDKLFEGINVICLFNKTILSVFHNFILNKTISCNGKDLLWVNEEIKQMIKNKNEMYKQYICNEKFKHY